MNINKFAKQLKKDPAHAVSNAIQAKVNKLPVKEETKKNINKTVRKGEVVAKEYKKNLDKGMNPQLAAMTTTTPYVERRVNKVVEKYVPKEIQNIVKTPQEYVNSIQSNIINIPKTNLAGNAALGVSQLGVDLMQPFVHPIETTKQTAQFMIDPSYVGRQVVSDLVQGYQNWKPNEDPVKPFRDAIELGIMAEGARGIVKGITPRTPINNIDAMQIPKLQSNVRIPQGTVVQPTGIPKEIPSLKSSSNVNTIRVNYPSQRNYETISLNEYLNKVEPVKDMSMNEYMDILNTDEGKAWAAGVDENHPLVKQLIDLGGEENARNVLTAITKPTLTAEEYQKYVLPYQTYVQARAMDRTPNYVETLNTQNLELDPNLYKDQGYSGAFTGGIGYYKSTPSNIIIDTSGRETKPSYTNTTQNETPIQAVIHEREHQKNYNVTRSENEYANKYKNQFGDINESNESASHAAESLGYTPEQIVNPNIINAYSKVNYDAQLNNPDVLSYRNALEQAVREYEAKIGAGLIDMQDANSIRNAALKGLNQ